ncbi:MAG TPA: helix-turn-helix transcriptional regulator [Terriglobia bacterium]|nr:helix-turn-helix transcriptional regulator [Terriglobia bacterium]
MKWSVNINDEIDVEVLEESALARAQATIQGAMDEVGISKADLARKMDRNKSFVSRMLCGNHNLTVKTMTRALVACGFEVEFNRVPVAWNWESPAIPNEEALPAQAGSAIPTSGQ